MAHSQKNFKSIFQSKAKFTVRKNECYKWNAALVFLQKQFYK